MNRRIDRARFWAPAIILAAMGIAAAAFVSRPHYVPPSIRDRWTRIASNPILSATSPWEQHVVEEPSVLYDSETRTWKMWYSGGWADSAIGYATCEGNPTERGCWKKHPGPVLGQGGSGINGFAARNNIVRVGNGYRLFFSDAAGGGNLHVSTSDDGVHWTAPIIAVAKDAVGWMPGGWANSFAWKDASGWRMFIEGSAARSGGQPWQTAYATSRDGMHWSIIGRVPVTSLAIPGQRNYGGPWLIHSRRRYELWYHAGTDAYSDIYRAVSTDGRHWITRPELGADRSSYETQQVADPSVVEHGRATYLFYSGVDNTRPAGYINVAVNH